MTYNILVPPSMPLNQQSMYAMIYEREKERFEGYKVHLLDRFFPLTRLKHSAVIGLFAWTSSELRQKWILKPHAVPNGGTWVTPGDLARDYLSEKFQNRRVRCTTAQYAACVQDRRNTPVYCKPCTLEDAVYIDIKSAYWSILKAVGWDVNYLPGRFIGVQSDVSDFPFPDNKMARNSLVSLGLTGGFNLWDGQRLKRLQKPNRFVNLVLYRLVCDVLNNVASDCIDSGAVYAFTDGFIVPRERLDYVIQDINDWGLEYTIKHEGACTVRAPAEYYFPQFSTKVLPRKTPVFTDKVYSEHRTWLKLRFGNWSRRGRDSGRYSGNN